MKSVQTAPPAEPAAAHEVQFLLTPVIGTYIPTEELVQCLHAFLQTRLLLNQDGEPSLP
jgi:hypothetical protein